jgi:hypothetical protein
MPRTAPYAIVIVLGRVSQITFGRPGPALEPGPFPYNHDLCRRSVRASDCTGVSVTTADSDYF